MIVYGKQICNHLLERRPELVREIYLAKTIDKKNFALLKRLGKPVIKVDAKKAQAMAKGGNHQGWLCDVLPYRYATLEELKGSDFLVVLAGLSDVGNIGAIIRSAYSLGADGVIVGGIKQLQSESVVRTSSGAMFDLPVAVIPNLLDCLNELKQIGFTIYGADMSGVSIDDISFNQRRVLVMGSEGSGIPGKIKKMLDERVTIRMARPFDSLNVSVAAGIIMYRMGYAG
ncbi:23S rRNA (guanosine(2251)-2'-O)-methyltransferase RlmB [Hydrogenimonas thermophila]|uniref:23S rRNA (Guanosine2251-2'-O)-methyltransferase n=1 Tax=Hydrogenimonas thermophila TaxID=223786 RepID=A0A1I5RIC1_9BACT|nr:23S rRNA (guanosine(2251)-2'-O)-methyltransferase RlmB [Hydrogenimonas thermophila]WOE69704.1 23S rRNA (guanosine(2251)-2'-O)-methyltransferase RlmB [Hydrogenimonas thermophila]WOE72218.1 23S rRNA (guanosine(2251)-2'-O)-methyltransferase RlmB [Hydrogenimonas thermophila]SFP58255.1 23S rRNA (guanosine2251-2'-O)-methyltransferase [Hydrogenimonas thermophila]